MSHARELMRGMDGRGGKWTYLAKSGCQPDIAKARNDSE